MKILEKITLTIYSILMLIISIVVCLVIFNWMDIEIIQSLIIKALSIEAISKIVLVISIIFILLSIKCIFFSSSEREGGLKNGVLLQNENGKLVITEETLEGLVNSVAKGFDSVDVQSTKIELDDENNVIVFVNLIVSQNVVIKELSTNLQSKIKETIKRMSDLEVKEVNIRIKNVSAKVEE